MLENASPLPVKAAGGVRTYEETVEMIRLGVKRIGTSGAKAIANGQKSGRWLLNKKTQYEKRIADNCFYLFCTFVAFGTKCE